MKSQVQEMINRVLEGADPLDVINEAYPEVGDNITYIADGYMMQGKVTKVQGKKLVVMGHSSKRYGGGGGKDREFTVFKNSAGKWVAE